jgi:glucose/arabinose dehydrogenase
MKALLMMLALLLLLACSSFLDTPVPPPPPPGTPTLQLVTNLLSNPVYAVSPPGDTLRLFVVEQAGRVRVLRRDTLLATPFLDLRGKIASGGERGLLSLAFHPQYATNGRFYVYFTDSLGDIRIVRYLVSAADSNVADSLSADTVLAVPHPGQSNHNGGQLQFGPDGKLYAGLGDGGGGGDPDTNAQNRHRLLGKLLRLDVDGASGYTVPATNPFVSDTSARPEIWAYGLRNPWRFSFDRTTGDLYIADVGQSAWEEVDVQGVASTGGQNYGWNVMEGLYCYNVSTCNKTGLTFPVITYNHPVGCSITGGYVYRGSQVPMLSGYYLFADYCTHFVRGFTFSGGQATQVVDWTPYIDPGGSVSSFAQDQHGELYIMTLGGSLFRIVATP